MTFNNIILCSVFLPIFAISLIVYEKNEYCQNIHWIYFIYSLPKNVQKKNRFKTVRKRCSVTDRKQYLVNGSTKPSVICPYPYCLLISVYENYWISVKQPFFISLGPFTDRSMRPGYVMINHKKMSNIIHLH